MQAVVFHHIGDIRLDEVPQPQAQASTGAADAKFLSFSKKPGSL